MPIIAAIAARARFVMPLMIDSNDEGNKDIIHAIQPRFSVQFHREACGGPTDTDFLFTHFIRNISAQMFTCVMTIPFSLPVVHRKVLVLRSDGLTIGQAGEIIIPAARQSKRFARVAPRRSS